MRGKIGGVNINSILTGETSNRDKFNNLMRSNLTRRIGNPAKEARYGRTKSLIEKICGGSCLDDYIVIDNSEVGLRKDEPICIVLNCSLVDNNHDILIYEISDVRKIEGGLVASVGHSPLHFFKTYTKSDPGYFKFDYISQFANLGMSPTDFTIPIPEYIFSGVNDDMQFVHAAPKYVVQSFMEGLEGKIIKAETKRDTFDSEDELKKRDIQMYQDIKTKIESERVELDVVKDIKYEMLGYFMTEVLDMKKRSATTALNKLDLDSDDLRFPEEDPDLRLMFRYKSILSYYERKIRRGNCINDLNGFRVITRNREQYYKFVLFPIENGWKSIVGNNSPYDVFPRMSGHQSLNTRWIDNDEKKIEIQYFNRASYRISKEGSARFYYVFEEKS